MTTDFVSINHKNIGSFVSLYVAVFNQPSWNEMCVAPDLQRQSIGTKLLMSFEQELIIAGFERIFLETGASAPARSFYEKLGYSSSGLVALKRNLQ